MDVAPTAVALCWWESLLGSASTLQRLCEHSLAGAPTFCPLKDYHFDRIHKAALRLQLSASYVTIFTDRAVRKRRFARWLIRFLAVHPSHGGSQLSAAPFCIQLGLVWIKPSVGSMLHTSRAWVTGCDRKHVIGWMYLLPSRAWARPTRIYTKSQCMLSSPRAGRGNNITTRWCHALLPLLGPRLRKKIQDDKWQQTGCTLRWRALAALSNEMNTVGENVQLSLSPDVCHRTL